MCNVRISTVGKGRPRRTHVCNHHSQDLPDERCAPLCIKLLTARDESSWSRIQAARLRVEGLGADEPQAVRAHTHEPETVRPRSAFEAVGVAVIFASSRTNRASHPDTTMEFEAAVTPSGISGSAALPQQCRTGPI